jgi:hypothetical protein
MSSWDGGFAPAQNFHPEFGYLCPTARLRRRLRGAVITLAAGTVIAGSMALAVLPQLAPQPPGDGARQGSLQGSLQESVQEPMQETALPATVPAPVVEVADRKATRGAAEAVSAATLARAVVMGPAAASRAQATCEDLAASFLAPQCQLGKAGKSRSSRAAHARHDAGNRVTTGRADAAAQAGPPQAASLEAGSPETGTGKIVTPAPAVETAVAIDEAATVAMPPKPARKPIKTERRQAPDAATARTTPAASPGFDLFALFRQPPRTGNGIFALQR